MKHTLASIFALGAILLVPACGSEAASAAGSYTVEFDMQGIPAEQKAMMAGMIKNGALELNADKTFQVSMDMMGNKMVATGTWTLADGKLTMTTTEQNGEKMAQPEVKEATFTDGAFRMTEQQGDQKMTFIMKKKS